MEPGRALVLGAGRAWGWRSCPCWWPPRVPVPDGGVGLWLLAAVPPALAALLLALGTMIAYPFEMDTIVRLSGDRLVATHYGLYNTICGVGITLGNLLTGAALDAARAAGRARAAVDRAVRARPGLRGRPLRAAPHRPPGVGFRLRAASRHRLTLTLRPGGGALHGVPPPSALMSVPGARPSSRPTSVLRSSALPHGQQPAMGLPRPD